MLIVAGAAGVYAVLHGGTFDGEDEKTLAISVGTISGRSGEVRYRFGDSLIWKEAQAAEPVSWGDAIFTAENGRAKVHFNSGREATVLPNSMVVIHEPAREPDKQRTTGLLSSFHKAVFASPVIEIQKGSIELKRETGKGTQPILVKAGSKTYQIDLAPKPSAPDKDTRVSAGPSRGTNVSTSTDTVIISLNATPAAEPGPAPNGGPAPASTTFPFRVEADESIAIHVVAVAETKPSAPAGSPPTDVSTRTPAAAPEPTPSPSPLTIGEQRFDKIDEMSESEKSPDMPGNIQPTSTPSAPLRETAPQISPSPSPSPAPSATRILPLPTPDDSFAPYSLISISPLVSFSKINARDLANSTQSTLASGLNYGASASWTQRWSKSFQTVLAGGFESLEFTSSSATEQLTQPDVTLGGLDLQGKWGEDGGIQILVHLGAGLEPFVHGVSSQAFTLDKVLIPDVGTGISFPLYESVPFGLRTEFIGDYLAPGSSDADIPYSVRSGYSLQGSFSLEQRAQDPHIHRKLLEEIFVRYVDQGTSLTDQNILEIGASLRFSFDFFGGRSAP